MRKKTYHFIGIGGISMSGLAKILHQNGHKITGSDINPNVRLDFATIFENFSTNNIKNADVVVYNSAIKSTDKELVEAKKQNKKILTRAELLNEIAQGYKTIIAVAGMHGKTTTTEMLAEILIRARKNPTVHLGGVSNFFNSNIKIGEKDFFITEACEYADSFLTLHPNISIILNIEPEHMDYFKNIKNIKKSFMQFANQSEIIICENKTKFNNLLKNNKKILKYNKNNYLFAKNIKKNKNKLIFDIIFKNKTIKNITLNSCVQKNIDNALACFLVCKQLKINIKYFREAMKNFKGVKRRMETIQESPLILHDYAHHPTELKAVINSAKNFFKLPLFVAFQPHTYTRTQAFFDDYVSIFSNLEKSILIKTYPARESKILGATAFDIFTAVNNKIKEDGTKNKCFYCDKFSTAQKLIEKLSPLHTTLILGAGDIDTLANSFK